VPPCHQDRQRSVGRALPLDAGRTGLQVGRVLAGCALDKRMKTDGQAFLEYIAGASTNKFEIRFSRISTRLDLGAVLEAKELGLLYEAAFLATLCNISFNGLGGCAGEIRPDRELVRTMLEHEFMSARARFLSCPGMEFLSAAQKASIDGIFFKVFVSDANLSDQDMR